MTQSLEAATRFERRPGGRYVRELEEGSYWGVVTAHGGYLMALMLRAMQLEVADEERAPRMLSQHFLSKIPPGEIAIDVTLERVGRGVTSASARLLSEGRLVGLATAIFTKSGEGPAFLDEPMPQVRERGEPDREMVGFFVAKVHDEFEFHRRFGSGGAVVPCEDGGWIVPMDTGAWDHRLALVASDVWIPPIIRHPERLAATPSLHHIVHFGPSVGGPARDGDRGTPLLVRHVLSSGGEGLTDEDISLWAEDGRLLLKARQLRTVVPPTSVIKRDFGDPEN